MKYKKSINKIMLINCLNEQEIINCLETEKLNKLFNNEFSNFEKKNLI